MLARGPREEIDHGREESPNPDRTRADLGVGGTRSSATGDLTAPCRSGSESLRLAQPASADAATLDPALIGAQGEVAVSIVLDAAPVADVAAADGTPAQQRAQQERVAAQQDEFLGTVRSFDSGASTLATTQRAINAVIVEVDAGALDALAADDRVESISRVRDYELALFETVPYIGASAVQDLGFDGTGVKVANPRHGDRLHPRCLRWTGNRGRVRGCLRHLAGGSAQHHH